MSKYKKKIIICINKFESDTDNEIEFVKEYVKKMGYDIEICNSYKEGSKGSIELAKKIVEICDREKDFKKLYDYNDSIINKINKICKEIYRANNVVINNEIKKKIEIIEENNMDKLPICIAKTQYSFSDDPKKLGAPTIFEMKVTDIKLSSGAGFIVVLMGNIMTLPGLGKNSAYLNMDIDNEGNITGLF